MEQLKALTVRNPYAWLIARGIKDIENRTWRTKFRGTILIHSAAKWHDRGSELSNLFTPEQYAALTPDQVQRVFTQTQMPLSAIIGKVDIVDCVQDSKSVWAEPGAWHWVLDNPVFFENYLPGVKGGLSFWNVYYDVEDLLAHY